MTLLLITAIVGAAAGAVILGAMWLDSRPEPAPIPERDWDEFARRLAVVGVRAEEAALAIGNALLPAVRAAGWAAHELIEHIEQRQQPGETPREWYYRMIARHR